MKLEYYKYMVQIGLHDCAYLDVCKHFNAIFKTPSLQQNEATKLEVSEYSILTLKTTFQVLKCVVLYLLLSPHDNEKWELLHRTNEMRELEKLPQHKALLELFIQQELIFWKDTIEKQFSTILFAAKPSKLASNDSLLLPDLNVR